MKLIGISSALLLALGCGSSPKPTPVTPDTTTATGDTAAAGDTAATGDTAAAGDMAKAEPPPPDDGGYKIAALSAATFAPAMPDQEGGPEVSPVHGDPASGGAFFLKIPPGGKPGLHTHTADYHAIVISGKPKHWLPGGEKKAKVLEPGSYWFQPGGQPHGDECTGTEPCVALIVMSGPMDFTPTPKAKKVPVGKYVLVPRKDAKLAPLDPKQPDGLKIAVLSGDLKAGPVAFLLEMPPGGNSGMHSHTSDYHAIVLDGAPAHWLPGDKSEGQAVEPGTAWFQPAGYAHGDRCTGEVPCHAIVVMDKGFDFKPEVAQ